MLVLSDLGFAEQFADPDLQAPTPRRFATTSARQVVQAHHL
jgi:hypothetical protein